MKLTSLLTLALIGIAMTWHGCDDATVEPGPYGYPLDLEATGGSGSVKLTWTEAAVSTFEEYIIVRSTDSIPDTDEPELVGNQVIIERIDEVDETTFTDVTPPLEKVVFYKIFADIGNRFLITQTVRIEQDLQLIDYRTDIVEPIPAKDELVGFDRSFDILFRYNYVDREIKANRSFSFNFPVLRYGNYNGTDEIYAVDQSSFTLYVFRLSDLALINQYTASSGIIDFFYSNGVFILATSGGEIEVRTRSNWLEQASTFTQSGTRILQKISEESSKVEFLEISFNQVAKYSYSSSTLQRSELRTDILGSSQLISSMHPDQSEVLINNNGRILKTDLSDKGVLGNGLQFYSGISYADNGEQIAAFGFVGNNIEVQFFEVADSYPLISSLKLTSSPNKIWGDNGKFYTTTVIFINGGVRSVIITYLLP